jgi:hypothetical protein
MDTAERLKTMGQYSREAWYSAHGNRKDKSVFLWEHAIFGHLISKSAYTDRPEFFFIHLA